MEDDLKKIKAVQDKVDSLVISYLEKYGEKPPVDWLEVEFSRSTEVAKKDLQDILSYWSNSLKKKEGRLGQKEQSKAITTLKIVLNSLPPKRIIS